MECLGVRDTRVILDFLSAIYDQGNLSEFRDRLVANLAKLIPCDLASYDEMNPDRRTSLDLGSPHGVLTPEFMRERWEPVMHEHPVLMHAQRTGDLRAYRISDFYSQREFHRRALHGEFYRKFSAEDVLCKGIQVRGRVVIGCALHRSRRTFTDKESLVLDLIGPHLAQAWRNAEAISHLHQQMEGMGKAWEVLGCGVVALSHSGRVSLVTPSARSTLEKFFGKGSASDHRLPAIVTRWVGAQRKEFSPDRLPRPLAPLVVERGESRLVVRLAISDAQDLLLLQEEHRGVERAHVEALGLSRREAEVLTWVAEGKTNAEIAIILEMSPRTVQKHLEHVFVKLGVETRIAAANVLRASQNGNSLATVDDPAPPSVLGVLAKRAANGAGCSERATEATPGELQRGGV